MENQYEHEFEDFAFDDDAEHWDFAYKSCGEWVKSAHVSVQYASREAVLRAILSMATARPTLWNGVEFLTFRTK